MWGDRHAAMPASRGDTTAVPGSTGWRGKIVTVPPDSASSPNRLRANVVMRTVSLDFSIC
jgi:hypothetical protein